MTNYYTYHIDLKKCLDEKELFNESNGKSIIQLFFENTNEIDDFPIYIIYKLFEPSNKNLIKKLLKINKIKFIKLIKVINDYDLLTNCFNLINKYYLIKYANEEILLTKTNDGITILEKLIQMNIDLSDVISDKSYKVAEILYNNKSYQNLLKIDCSILLNYPNKKNNYLNLIIEKNIFKSFTEFKSQSNESIAQANILLLENNIKINYNYTNLFLNKNNINQMPVFFYMIKINKKLTLNSIDNTLLRNYLINYISNLKNIKRSKLLNLNINLLITYILKPNNFLTDLENGKITKITKNDIYREDLMTLKINNESVLEYALKNNIEIYTLENPSLIEIMILLKYKKIIPKTSKQILLQKVNNDKKMINYLIETKNYQCIQESWDDDLSIIDNYCSKYNCYKFLNQKVIERLLVEENSYFSIEKYLNNDNFLEVLSLYIPKIPKYIIFKLLNKGYKNPKLYSNQNILLIKNKKNITILEILLKSNIIPNFSTINNINILEYLYQYNHPELFHKANLNLLMNYPNGNNNYLKYMIKCYTQDLDVYFEKISCFNKYYDNELIARFYIQMTNNGLEKYLEKLNPNLLLRKDKSNHTLLFYLITFNQELTINKILSNNIKRNSDIFINLNFLKVYIQNLKLDIKLDCYILTREIYNEEYDKDIIYPNKEIELEVINLLNEVRILFETDGKSNKELIELLIKSYHFLISTNYNFINELKTLIEIKKNNPDFYIIKELERNGFNKQAKSIFIGDMNINTLNHEIGHALHYIKCGNNYDIPDNFDEIINKIINNPNFIKKVQEYSKTYKEILNESRNKATIIVENFMTNEYIKSNEEKIQKNLLFEKEELIKKYLILGYKREDLENILVDKFTKDKFLQQKKEIEIEEIKTLILKNEYAGFLSIGDIIDAIVSGKFLSGLLKDKEGNIITAVSGHGIRCYNGSTNDKENKEKRFTEMIANFSEIIKSKNSNKMLKLLKDIVGDELINILEQFYINKIIKQNEIKLIKSL